MDAKEMQPKFEQTFESIFGKHSNKINKSIFRKTFGSIFREGQEIVTQAKGFKSLSTTHCNK